MLKSIRQVTCSMLAAVLSAGCYHSMEIVNLAEYGHEATAPRKVKLAVAKEPDTEEARNLAMAVFDALYDHPSVERIAVVESDRDFEPDAYVTVTPAMSYDGSGWNYWITFPGFLLFTHAWNGFIYEASVRTDITLHRPDSEREASKTVETRYDLRHCDFERGAVTSSGWYTPGWGALNLLIGFVMMKYDDDATPDFLQEVRRAYGSHIANHVVELTAAELAVSEAEQANPRQASCATFDKQTRRFETGC